jgi:hypothetical protein
MTINMDDYVQELQARRATTAGTEKDIATQQRAADGAGTHRSAL